MSLSAFDFTTRARPVVEIGIGDTHSLGGTTVWDGAHWDNDTDAHWSGTEPTWRDISCDCYSYDCQTGRASTIERFVAGSATVSFDNTSGWADPTHDTTTGELSMRPGRQIRLGVVHVEFGTVWLWRGYIDAVTPIYDPVQPDTVELRCIDALGEVNRAKSKPIPAPLYAGESADARIHRLLDNARWPTLKRDVWPSADTLIATDLGGQTADLLGQVADSVGGAVFGDQTNTVCFRPRDWQLYDPINPPDGSIGNSPFEDPNDVTFGDTDTHVVWHGDQVVWHPPTRDVCPVRWERPFERADISTRVILGRDPLSSVQVDDPNGILRYGIEPFERTDLTNDSDAAIANLAARVLVIRSELTAPRIRSVTLNAATSDGSLDLQATVDPFLPSRYRCRLIERRGLVFDEMHFATGVSHTVDRGTWETLINLDRSAPYANAGQPWDGAHWDVDVWSDVAITPALAPTGGP